jgi:alpha-glucan phosphorylase-like protein
LLQEIILGIGGVRVLEAAGIEIDQYHINEGHASFAIWERATIYAQKNGITISEALYIIRESTSFTTHTPVVHGNEEFKISKLSETLKYILTDFDANFNKFIDLGKTKSIEKEMFSMTAFGINLAGISNGVSQLHGDTAAKMWSEIYDDNKKIKPMTYVTNGIHFNSWMSDEVRTIVEINRIDETNVAKIIESYSSASLFDTKQKLKTNMFERLKNLPQISDDNFFFQHNSLESLKGSLVIGFARRFAPYKRADLIFRDVLKLLRIMEDLEVPVVMIFSGKAHPKDVDGKKLLSQVIERVNFEKLKNHILFVPDYDILVGRLLVQGCDIWLNNPIKPLEACGTSGMKSSLNFGVNLSVDDGWWHEAYNSNNGFVLDGNIDKVEITHKIYDLLENSIIPAYAKAQRSESYEWCEFMKQSFLTAYLQFSSGRMLNEYSGKLYEV